MGKPRLSAVVNRVHARQRGAAFIVALLVVTMMSGVVLVFARGMNTSAIASRSENSQTRARWIAQGAIEAIRGELADKIELGEPPRLDTVGVQAVEMGGGLYWVIGRNITTLASEDDGPEDIVFGLIGERGKFNLNEVEPAELSLLPGMTESLAAAVTNSLNEWAAEIEATGEEAEDTSLFESIDQLLLSTGITAEVLDGEDYNRNGVLDPNEDDGDESPPLDNADGRLDRGLRDFVTVYAYELSTSNAGEERINANRNRDNDELLEAFGPVVGETRAAQLVGTIDSGRNFTNILDLYARGGFTEDEFGQLHDLVRVGGEEDGRLEGRIDVYSAPLEVLENLSDLEAGVGETIVNARPALEDGEAPGDYAWLIEAISEDVALNMGPTFTYRSLQFSADVVAVSADGRGFSRLRYVLDIGPVVLGEADLPTVLYVQDLTSLGWPLDPEILTALRQGVSIEDVVSQFGPAGI